MKITRDDIVVDVAAGAYTLLFVFALPFILPCWLIGFGLKKLGIHVYF